MIKLTGLNHWKNILNKRLGTDNKLGKKALKRNRNRLRETNTDSLKSKSSFYQKIGVKLLIALFIPVVLLIAYGLISFNKTQDAIIKNYMGSAADTVSAVSDHFDFAFSVVNNKSVEYQLSPELRSYFRKEDPYNIQAPAKSINQKSMIDITTNAFIKNICMLGSNGNGLNISNEASFYSSFKDSDLAKKIDESKDKYVWAGYHKMLDEAITYNGKAYSTNDYALSIVRDSENKNGYIVIDISSQQIKKTLAKYDLGDGSIIAFITGDGREITADSKDNNIFTETEYYKKASKGETLRSHSYVKYKNKEYLFIYSRLNITDSSVCALIPKSTITKSIQDIKNLNVLFVVFACLIAIITGAFISIGITRAINHLRACVLQAAEGDLTTKFDTKRKDEFLVLSNGIGNMVGNMRKLIGEASAVGSGVIKSAENLYGTSKDLLTATKAISQTMENTQQGIVQQANDTESCLIQMTGLSEEINSFYQNTNEIKQIADTTKSISGEGIVIINELADKAKATSDITQSIINKVQEFEIQSESIKSFVNVISEIAAQTNLLSLNASIEAARAGEYGRGFAIVASEIRKLADQSVEAVAQIQKIVNEIHSKTKDTVNTVHQAEVIVESQSGALDNTVEVFQNINAHVQKLVNNLDSISNGIKRIETAKEDTLLAIESISAVSEQSAASTEEISATALNQIDSVERLSQEVLELEKEAKRLEKAINVFKTN